MRAKLSVIALLLITALFSSSCGDSLSKRVLVLWPTSMQDPVCEQRSKEIKKAFKDHKIKIHLEQEFMNVGYKEEDKMDKDLSSHLDKMQSIGKSPDLILVSGDLCHHIVMISSDSRLRKIPIISFDVNNPISNDHPDNMVLIRDSINIGKNLEFMNTILKKDNQKYITVFDWTTSPIDEKLRESISKQMDALDSSKFFNGMLINCTETELNRAVNSGKTALYALSLDDMSANRSLITGEPFYTSTAFLPETSENRVIFFQHDHVTARLETIPDYPAYFSAISGVFGVRDNCIGGYFSDFGAQMENVIQKAMLIFKGTNPWDIPVSYSKQDYHANWDAVKEFGDYEDYPEYINFINAGLSDRKPVLFSTLSLIGGLLLIPALSMLLFIFFRGIYFSHRLRRKIRINSENAVEEMNNFQRMISHSDATLWSLEGKTLMYDGAKNSKGVLLSDRINLSNEYFRGKLIEFFDNNLPGSYRIQFPRTDPDGEEHWYEIRLFIKDGRYGLEKQGISFIIDEQKKMEAEIHEAHRLRTVANEREKFISIMSHEMRTPLNSIVGFSQILSNPDYACNEEELKIFGRAIENNNQELMKIIEDMLAITHMDNANIKMNLEDIYIKDVFEKQRDIYVQRNENAKDVKFVVQEGPLDACVHVDEKLFITILNNIVSNAIKFSPEHSMITLGWREGNYNIVIYVIDYGIGISKPDQENIFKRFYQVNNFTQGTGLGLALAKEYAERMGGSVRVESELGCGATFSIRFPKIKKGGTAV